MSTLRRNKVQGELVLKIGEIIANLMVMFISEFIDICCKFIDICCKFMVSIVKDGGASCFSMDQYRASLFRRSASALAITFSKANLATLVSSF